MNEWFGKELILSTDVKYVGDGEDPATNPVFIAWKQAFESLNIEPKFAEKKE